ncbi:MAG: hypothetical protein AAF483_30170 [Planctomycetota bacterium]
MSSQANRSRKARIAQNAAEREGNGPVDPQESPAIYSSTAKWVVSILLLFHLTAVVAEPFRFFSLSSRGTSPAADPPREWLAPYVEFTYLNHGYFFFAPEPGPSHLIDCSFQQVSPGEEELGQGEDQSQRFSVRYPDREAQWPRLLYHRHFMLTENLHQLWVPPVDPVVAMESPDLARDWRNDRQRFEQIRDSMAGHVAYQFGVDRVELERVEHRLLSDIELFERKLPLNDPSTYFTLPDQEPEVGSAPDDAENTIDPALLGPLRFDAPSTGDPISAEEMLQEQDSTHLSPAGGAAGKLP